MRVLITGGSGLLGKYLLETAPPSVEVWATWYTNFQSRMYQMNVCDKSQIAYVFDRVKPELVMHCGVVTKVDYAEKNYRESQQVCVQGTQNVHDACKRVGARLVFPSTNAVFSGEEPSYREDDKREPINVYGSIRRRAENAVMQGENWLILRLFLMFGWPWERARPNWATIALDKLEKGESLKIVNDKWYQPAYALNVAETIWALSLVIEKDDVYHVAPQEAMTLFEFVKAVAEVFDLDPDLVNPVSSDEFPNIAPRPTNSTYDVSKLNDLGLKIPDARDGLLKMKRDGGSR